MSSNLVFVGASAVSPFGIETADFIQGVNHGSVAFEVNPSLGTYLDNTELLAAQVPAYSAKKVLNVRGIGNWEPITQHLCVAAQNLQQQLGFSTNEDRANLVKDDQLSLLLGSTGPVQSVVEFDHESREEPEYVSPGLFPNVVLNVPACFASIRYSVKASVVTLNDGDTSSANAIHLADKKLKSQRADMVWVGGAEALTPSHALMADAMGQSVSELRFSEGAYLLAAVRQETADSQELPIYAELEASVSFYCPDRAQADAELIRQLKEKVEDGLTDLNWLVGRDEPFLQALNSNAECLDVQGQLGYLAAAKTAAAVMYMLVNQKIHIGDRFLVVDSDNNGSVSALLIRKKMQLNEADMA